VRVVQYGLHLFEAGDLVDVSLVVDYEEGRHHIHPVDGL